MFVLFGFVPTTNVVYVVLCQLTLLFFPLFLFAKKKTSGVHVYTRAVYWVGSRPAARHLAQGLSMEITNEMLKRLPRLQWQNLFYGLSQQGYQLSRDS